MGFKQAAPGNYRTRCFVPSYRSGILDPLNVTTNLSRVETFAGAACSRSFVVMRAPRQISRVSWARSKAAPLQTVGITHHMDWTTPYDDEYEDEIGS